MQNINGFVSVPVSFAGLQTIDHQPAGRDPLPLPPFVLPFLMLPVPFRRRSRSAFMARSGPFLYHWLRSPFRRRQPPLWHVPGASAAFVPVPAHINC